MALNGDFSAEKEYVCKETRQGLAALAEDRVLSRKEKELVIKTAICIVFSYSAGFVDWSNTELEDISRMWIQAYNYIHKYPRIYPLAIQLQKREVIVTSHRLNISLSAANGSSSSMSRILDSMSQSELTGVSYPQVIQQLSPENSEKA
jgi:hypothetical protein